MYVGLQVHVLSPQQLPNNFLYRSYYSRTIVYQTVGLVQERTSCILEETEKSKNKVYITLKNQPNGRLKRQNTHSINHSSPNATDKLSLRMRNRYLIYFELTKQARRNFSRFWPLCAGSNAASAAGAFCPSLAFGCLHVETHQIGVLLLLLLVLPTIEYISSTWCVLALTSCVQITTCHVLQISSLHCCTIAALLILS